MIDLTLLDQYLDESTMMMNENSRENLRNLLIRFFNQKADKEYSELTRQDFIEMFSELKTASTNSFETYRSKIGDFMKWMYENGQGPEKVLNEMMTVHYSDLDRKSYYDTYYFIDYNDFEGSLAEIFEDRGTEFDTFKAAAILVWFGFDVKTLPDILKKDVLEDENCVVDPVTKEKVELLKIAIKFLVSYRDADTYDSNKFGGRNMVYVKTQYLFRSYKNAYMTSAQLVNIINTANRVAEDFGKKFTWKAIALSGLYSRMFQYEQEHGDIDRYDYELLKRFFKKENETLSPNQKRYLSQKYDEYLEFKTMKMT